MVRAVYMGSEGFSIPPLEALWQEGPSLARPVELVGVVTQPDRGIGRGRVVTANAVKQFGLHHGLPVLQPPTLRQAAGCELIEALRPDLIVVASYGQILPRTVLDLPSMGCLNIHPSLLPRYRGPSPVVGAILNGDAVTGVCLMQMVPRMDAGPIVSSRQRAIAPHETAGELTLELAFLGAQLLMDELPAWLDGKIEPKPQVESDATYTRLLVKAEGELDWHHPSLLLARQVMAFNPWPVARTNWRDKKLRILRADSLEGHGPPGKVVGSNTDGLLVGTGSNLLRVRELQLPGRKPVTAKEFLAGHGDVLDAVFRATP